MTDQKVFEKLYREKFKANGDHNTHSLEWVDHPMDLDGDEPHYLVNHTQLYWEFFQAGAACVIDDRNRIQEAAKKLRNCLEKATDMRVALCKNSDVDDEGGDPLEWDQSSKDWSAALSVYDKETK